MESTDSNCVAVFDRHEDAEKAIRDLQHGGFDMKIPGIGPILTGGIIGSAIMGTVEGAAVGAALGGGTTALAAALSGLGVPDDSVIRYEAALKANKSLLIASGSPADVEKARAILAGTAMGQVQVHTP